MNYKLIKKKKKIAHPDPHQNEIRNTDFNKPHIAVCFVGGKS
jgi:hypothetical protein